MSSYASHDTGQLTEGQIRSAQLERKNASLIQSDVDEIGFSHLRTDLYLYQVLGHDYFIETKSGKRPKIKPRKGSVRMKIVKTYSKMAWLPIDYITIKTLPIRFYHDSFNIKCITK